MSARTPQESHRMMNRAKHDEWLSWYGHKLREENARLTYEAQDKAYRAHEERMRTSTALQRQRQRYEGHPEVARRELFAALTIGGIAAVGCLVLMLVGGVGSILEAIGMSIFVFIIVCGKIFS